VPRGSPPRSHLVNPCSHCVNPHSASFARAILLLVYAVRRHRTTFWSAVLLLMLARAAAVRRTSRTRQNFRSALSTRIQESEREERGSEIGCNLGSSNLNLCFSFFKILDCEDVYATTSLIGPHKVTVISVWSVVLKKLMPSPCYTCPVPVQYRKRKMPPNKHPRAS